MAAPEFVPVPPAERPRVYQSPPRRPDSWVNNRPGDFNGPQPTGPGLGSPGPDQGYVLKLARQFHGKLSLTEGEHEEDAIAGCSGVALKRASIFGRAPIVHDLTMAFSIWGFLGEGDADLIALRKPMFEEVGHPHHYLERRAIADSVPESVLRMTVAQVRLQAATDWRSLIDVGSAVPALTPRAATPPPAPPVPAPLPPPPPVEEPVADGTASDPVVEAESDPAVLPEVDPTPAVEEAPAIDEEPVPGVEVSTDGETPSDEAGPADAAPPPRPVDADEVADLARQARLAFRKRPQPPQS